MLLLALALAAGAAAAGDDPPPTATTATTSQPATDAAPGADEAVTAAPAEGPPAAPTPAPAPAPTTIPAAAPPGATTTARTRVFVAPIDGANADATTVDLVEDRILVAARTAAPGLDVLGARDVQDILDAEAARQALGCDTTGCAAEIADALDAEQLVTGQLGRIGETWQLTLTRTERASLRVIARSQRQARGDTPEGLLGSIDAQLLELFSDQGVVEPGLGALGVSGIVVAGIGGAALLAAAGLWGGSWLSYADAEGALAAVPPDVPKARGAVDTGVVLYDASLIVAVAGGVAAVAGVALLSAALWLEDE